jgi:hypothetical protein
MNTQENSERGLNLQAAIDELYLVSVQRLESVEGRASLRGQVERAVTRAAMSFEQARMGLRTKHHLRRTVSALVSCRTGFKLLCLEGLVDAREYEDTRIRTEQVLTALLKLEALPLEEWPTIDRRSDAATTPIQAEARRSGTLAAIKLIRARVSEVMSPKKKMRPPKESPGGTEGGSTQVAA